MRHTMTLGDSINTYDPDEALRNEVGTFKVKVPEGCELFYTVNPNGTTTLRWGNPNTRAVGPFLITKISEPAHGETVLPISKAG